MALKTLAAFVRTDPDGARWLEGFRCRNCGEVVLENRAACPKCAKPGSLAPAPLRSSGRLHSFTIVHRSFPGIATPFVSAVVELDEGGFVRGNVVGIPPDPRLLKPGLRLRVAFEEIAVDAQPGEKFVRHVFIPETVHLAEGATT
jgi:uncharacterized OB-fold protein